MLPARPGVHLQSNMIHIEPRGREGTGERAISLTASEAVDVAAQLLSYAGYLLPMGSIEAYLAALDLKIKCDEFYRGEKSGSQ